MQREGDDKPNCEGVSKLRLLPIYLISFVLISVVCGKNPHPGQIDIGGGRRQRTLVSVGFPNLRGGELFGDLGGSAGFRLTEKPTFLRRCGASAHFDDHAVAILNARENRQGILMRFL